AWAGARGPYGPAPAAVHGPYVALASAPPPPRPASPPGPASGGYPAGSAPVRRKQGRLATVLATCASVALLALFAATFLPEVIRIPLPGGWKPHVPRVEFVSHPEPAESATAVPPEPARASQVQLATRTPVEGVKVAPAP